MNDSEQVWNKQSVYKIVEDWVKQNKTFLENIRHLCENIKTYQNDPDHIRTIIYTIPHILAVHGYPDFQNRINLFIEKIENLELENKNLQRELEEKNIELECNNVKIQSGTMQVSNNENLHITDWANQNKSLVENIKHLLEAVKIWLNDKDQSKKTFIETIQYLLADQGYPEFQVQIKLLVKKIENLKWEKKKLEKEIKNLEEKYVELECINENVVEDNHELDEVIRNEERRYKVKLEEEITKLKETFEKEWEEEREKYRKLSLRMNDFYDKENTRLLKVIKRCCFCRTSNIL